MIDAMEKVFKFYLGVILVVVGLVFMLGLFGMGAAVYTVINKPKSCECQVHEVAKIPKKTGALP